MRTFACLLTLAAAPLAFGADEAPRSRSFLFTYAATISDLPKDATARVWLPVPPSNDEQWVRVEKLPAGATIAYDPVNDNHYLYLDAKPDADGKVSLEVVYRVKRHELKSFTETYKVGTDRIKRFLEADSLVPIDGKPLTLLEGKKLPDDAMGKARVLYDVVNNHMKYDKSKPGWGRGDAVWACESGFGNCSDFHSLFISLARAKKIPAKFVCGFPLPEKRGKGEVPGYHCWAKFRPSDKGWVGVDISEANKNPGMKDYYFGNLTEDRVAFSKGRDLVLVPKQDGKPLNFFIYPYVEVGGKPYAADKIEKKFTYEDQP
jgi:transglutaminase-like putative cysteine protease